MSGAGACAGTGAGNAEKDTPPQAVEWGGAGKTAGGPRFSGPRPPRNEVYIRATHTGFPILILPESNHHTPTLSSVGD